MAASNNQLHDKIWQSELAVLGEFYEALVTDGDNKEFWVMLRENCDCRWTQMFRCAIGENFVNNHCPFQSKYLRLVNKCLDNRRYGDFLAYLELTHTYTKPLMHYVAETNFSQNLPIESWDFISKLAFNIVFKMAVPRLDHIGDIERQIQVAREIERILKDISNKWAGSRRASYLMQLSEAFEHFEADGDWLPPWDTQLNSNQNRQPCRCPARFHQSDPISSIKSLLIERTLYSANMNQQQHHKFLNVIRKSILNICNVEFDQEQGRLLLGLFGISPFGDGSGLGALACNIYHDEQFIKAWSRLFIERAPYENCTLLYTFPRALFSRPKTRHGLLADDEEEHPKWVEFLQRSKWFVEVYRECFATNLKAGLMPLITWPIRNFANYTVQSASRLLAVLQLHDTLSEQQHLEIIEHVIKQELDRVELLKHNETPGHSSDAPSPSETIADFVLTLNKEASTQLISMLRPTGFDGVFFSEKALDECVLRFFKPDTPEHMLRAALITANLYQKDVMYLMLRQSSLYPVRNVYSYPRISRDWYEKTIGLYRTTNNGRTKFRLRCVKLLINLIELNQHVGLVLETLEDFASIYLITRLTSDHKLPLSSHEAIVPYALDKCRQLTNGERFWWRGGAV